MQNAAVAVAAFTREVVALFAVRLHFGIKQHALIDKPLHAVAGVAGDKLDGAAIAQASACNQRVLYMRGDAVGFVKNRGYTALGIKGGAFAQRTFAQYYHLAMFRQAQRQ